MEYWTEKIVVVTGGSAGLGAAIARAFAQQGATVVSVSRTRREAEGGIEYFQADVTKDEDVARLVNSVVEKFGRIDVWVNNVGKSIRVGFKDAALDEYRDLMEMNFFTSVRCSLAALPHLVESSGSLVQIGSLASKTAWQHVSPYVTSKHALAGFAHQLRLEGPANVHNLFVCPGPIRRDDAHQRYEEQTKSLGESANAPGGGVKLKGIDSEWLANKIVDGCRKRKSEIVIPAKTRILFSIAQLSAGWGDWLLRKFAK
jgi:NAD(P)-dependent dehydrogenase (short-subunit alcohol dehydrogenase family)